jgi:hypothetical protein
MSTYPDRDELIQADIDGTASPRQRARLDEMLAGDAAAREEHCRLRSLRDLLASIPGAGVRWPLLSFWPGARVAIPYAYAAAAGAAIAVVGLQLFSGAGPLVHDAVEREAAATIGSVPVGAEAGRLDLVGGNVNGSATLRALADGLAVDVELPADGPVNVNLDFDPALVKFVGIANRTGGIDHIQIADGTVSWTQSRPQRVTVFVVPRTTAGSRVSVRFVDAGGAAVGGTLDLPGRN